MTDSLERCFSKASNIVSRKIADEHILVPIRQKAGELESIYTLTEVASRIWELIDGKKNVEELRDTIVEEFEVTPNQAEVDLLVFLKQLEEIGAVRTV